MAHTILKRVSLQPYIRKYFINCKALNTDEANFVFLKNVERRKERKVGIRGRGCGSDAPGKESLGVSVMYAVYEPSEAPSPAWKF